MNKLCGDGRCLYHGKQACSDKKFSTVTTETREGKGLWEQCDTCKLTINRSGVDPIAAESFYNDEYIVKNSYSAGELLDARAHFEQRVDSVKVIADRLDPYLKPSMRVLELGAATGELLYLIRNKVKTCVANEIHKLYAAFIRDELKIEASHQNYLKQEFSEPFDAVLSINTIDHMYDTGLAVEKIYKDLKPGGFFYVEVPNDNQALNHFLPEPQRKQFSAFMYQKAHYYSFTFETLRRLLEQSGFCVEMEESRHDYTLKNFLQWYFIGKPQSELKSAMLGTGLYAGESPFEKSMNSLFDEFNKRFKQVMAEHRAGESICMLARKPN